MAAMRVPKPVKSVIRRMATSFYTTLEVLGLPRIPARRRPKGGERQ